MTEAPRPSKTGRIVALVLMGLTVFFTLAGGIGTTCVAFGAENYESMVGLVPYKPLYQALVFISLIAGVWGIPVMRQLVRGKANAYRNALIVLVIGAVTSGIQTVVSQSVRGKSAPVNVRFAVTLLTLIVFLILRLPPLWRKMRFDQPLKGNSAKTAGGAVFAVCGLGTLSAPLWVAQTHMEPWISGVRAPLVVAGVALTVCGVALLTLEARSLRAKQVVLPERPAAIQ